MARAHEGAELMPPHEINVSHKDGTLMAQYLSKDPLPHPAATSHFIKSVGKDKLSDLTGKYQKGQLFGEG